MTNGNASLLTGERAEAKVRDTLLDAKFFCSKFEIDRGEDLLIEPEGYADQISRRSEPVIGLIQVRGHAVEDLCELSKDHAKLTLKVKHLKRWASIPLPVFVVRVELNDNKVRFFSESVDKLVHSVAPGGLAALDQETTVIQLRYIADLPHFLSSEIKAFYSSHAFQLAGLSANLIARNHYEVISTCTLDDLPTAKVWRKSVRILWKGPWRPAHFWATLNHVANELQQHGGKALPLNANIHVYRSLKDCRDNNAVAHVSWLEDTHPHTGALRQIVNWPKGQHWSRFRFNLPPQLDELPELGLPQEDDQAFITKIRAIWSQLDEISMRIVGSMNSDMRLKGEVQTELAAKFRSLDGHLNQQLGYPSPQYEVLDKMITQYAHAIFSIFNTLKDYDRIPEIRRQRSVQRELDKLPGYFQGFEPLYSALKDG